MMKSRLWFLDKVYLFNRTLILNWPVDMFESLEAKDGKYHLVSGDLDIHTTGDDKKEALEAFFVEFESALNYYAFKEYSDLPPHQKRLKALYDNIIQKEVISL